MLPNNPLEDLRDIHLPEAISAWPLAIGWYCLMLIIVLSSVFLAWKLLKKFNKMRAKYAALKKLKALKHAYENKMDAAYIAQQLSILLHRVALAYYPRKRVAGLMGEAWLNFLDEDINVKQQATVFSSKEGRLLTTAPYSQTVIDDLSPLFSLCEQWIQMRGK